jgi:hypothetical protein
MERLNFTHLTGTRAYLCLYIEYETQIPFEVLFNLEKNLEAILVIIMGWWHIVQIYL